MLYTNLYFIHNSIFLVIIFLIVVLCLFFVVIGNIFKPISNTKIVNSQQPQKIDDLLKKEILSKIVRVEHYDRCFLIELSDFLEQYNEPEKNINYNHNILNNNRDSYYLINEKHYCSSLFLEMHVDYYENRVIELPDFLNKYVYKD